MYANTLRDVKTEIEIRIEKLTHSIKVESNGDIHNITLWRSRRNELESMLNFLEYRLKYHLEKEKKTNELR